jgi:NitT/TauT family transport system permease protein
MKDSTSTFERRIIGIVSTVLFLVIWKIASVRVGAEIILPSPEDVFLRLIKVAQSRTFKLAVGSTALRTFYGFILSFAAGFVVGIACGSSRRIDAALAPLISIIRTVPVMSVILLAMIWFQTDGVPVFVCFLMVFPIITANVRQGVDGVDRKLLGMGTSYNLSRFQILTNITIPSVVPYVLAGLRASIGVAWKAVIAAEVLSQPLRAIGTGLQFSQMNLETAEVMAWTIAAIVFSWISEKLLDLAVKKLKWRPA